MTKKTKPVWAKHPKPTDLFSAIHQASLALKTAPTETTYEKPAERFTEALADNHQEGFVRDLQDELSALLEDLDSTT